MKQFAFDPEGMSDDRSAIHSQKANKTAHEPVRHVPVRDVREPVSHEAPLSAYMISPRYLPRDQIRQAAPKRPLGSRVQQSNRQPVKMYSEVATFGDMNRIRRPRTQHIPVEEISDDAEDTAPGKQTGFIGAAITAISDALLFVYDKAAATGHFIVDKARAIPSLGSKVRYSAFSGAAVRRFGVRENWLRVSAPVVLLLFLLGMGIFAVLDATKNGSHGGGTATQGGNNGGTVLQVQQSAHSGGKNNTPASSPQNGSPGSAQTPQSAGSAAQSQSNSGQFFQSAGALSGSGGTGSSGSTPVGGLGGGTAGGSTGSSPVVSGGSGGGSSSTGSSGGSGGSTSGSGSGSGLPTLTQPPITTPPLPSPTPLPLQVNVPSSNTSVDGKQIESTTPTTLTIN